MARIVEDVPLLSESLSQRNRSRVINTVANKAAIGFNNIIEHMFG